MIVQMFLPHRHIFYSGCPLGRNKIYKGVYPDPPHGRAFTSVGLKFGATLLCDYTIMIMRLQTARNFLYHGEFVFYVINDRIDRKEIGHPGDLWIVHEIAQVRMRDRLFQFRQSLLGHFSAVHILRVV